MAVTAIQFQEPTSGLVVPVMPVDGVSAAQIDASAPARAVVESRVGTRGGVDTTRNLDAGVLSLSMMLFPGLVSGRQPEAFLDQMGPLLDPSLRPYLIVTNPAWPNGPRRVSLRYDSVAKPWNDPTNWLVQFNFTAPDAVWEDQAVTSAVINAFIASSTGLTFDVGGLVVTSAGIIMPSSSAPSPSQVVSPGATYSHWQAFLYGPCSGPRWANDTQGKTIEFLPSLTLSAGEYVALDSQQQTCLLNSDPGSDVTGYLNFSTTDWWMVGAGLNILRYYPSSADAGAQAALSFHGAYPL